MINRSRLSLCLVFMASGCAQYDYSQFRSEDYNIQRVIEIYYKAIQSCNGKALDDHKQCSKDVESEVLARFDDRNKAFMSKADVARIITSRIIWQYQIQQSTGQSSVVKTQPSRVMRIPIAEGPALTGGASVITTKGVCYIPSFSPSISLSSSIIVSAVCR